MSEAAQLTRKDFISDQDVRWCPGCGDYAILSTVLKVLPDLGVSKENTVFISGIGCSSRFPYYANTYGFHTIHGRAPTIATGLKSANPDLSVWMITGDGDGFSIGGNHMLHLLRRNVNVNVLLFNNRIYGLTKGQYSPTSQEGLRTKSSPMGSIDSPLTPAAVALGSDAGFVARTTDTQIKHMEATIRAAAAHEGTSFIEILQNCVIFNDGVHEEITSKDKVADNQLILEEGQPLLFGPEDNRKGIVIEDLEPKVIDIKDESDIAKVMVHDSKRQSPAYANLLSRMYVPDFPVPVGVFRDVQRPIYDQQLNAQAAQATNSDLGLDDMIRGFGKVNTWAI